MRRNRNLINIIREYFSKGSGRNRFNGFVVFLAVIVLFVSFSALALPAISMDRQMSHQVAGLFLNADAPVGDADSPEDNDQDSELEEEKDPEPSGEKGEDYKEDFDESQEEDNKESSDNIEEGQKEEGTEEGTDQSDDGEDPHDSESSVEEEETEEEKSTDQPYLSGTFYADGDGYAVIAVVTEDALIPSDSEFYAVPVTDTEDYMETAVNELGDLDFTDSLFFDIGFRLDGEEVEPAVPITVTILLEGELDAQLLHFTDDGVEVVETDLEVDSQGAEVLVDLEGDLSMEIPKERVAGVEESLLRSLNTYFKKLQEDFFTCCLKALMSSNDNSGNKNKKSSDKDKTYRTKMVFSTDGFSIYAVVKTMIEKNILASDGHNYKITVTCENEAGVPADAQLSVEEITYKGQEDGQKQDSSAYEEYVSQAENALGWDEGSASYVRLFDIKIVDKNGDKIDIQAPVDVKIELADKDTDEDLLGTQVVHFADETGEAEVLDDVDIDEAGAKEQGVTVSFETSGFSVYAIVDAPKPAVFDGQTVSSLDELTENIGSEFRLYYGSTPAFFTSSLNNAGSFTESTKMESAAFWHFERASENDPGLYYIYTLINGEKKYIINTSDNFAGLGDKGETVFELSVAKAGMFYFKKQGEKKWLQHSNSGKGIRFWTDNNNLTNSAIAIAYVTSDTLDKDPYGLDGKTYGIAYHDESVTSVALTAESITVGGKERLAGFDMLMRPDVLDNEGVLLVANNSDIQEWTFRWVTEDKYYLETKVDGQSRYLTVYGTAVTLEENPDQTASLIRALPGSDSFSGKWHFSVNGYSLNLPGDASGGFNVATGNSATTWMNLVDRSVLSEDDFTLYNAKKVSVSDTENVYDHQKIIIYTRIWNGSKYEFYAVDHDGSLIRAYDTGDGIEWIGSQVNTALWDFSEGKDADGKLTHYYWLQNTQYKTYLVPQKTSGQVIYTSSAGNGTTDLNASVNLNGRRYGENYTMIIAWDDDDYAYSGFRTTRKGKGWHIVPCALAEAEDFYFAVVNPIDPTDTLTTVDTIDSSQYGISMKMINFNNKKTGPADSPRDSVQNNYFGGDNNNPGLLSTNLINDYPTSTQVTNNEGHSLSELFTGMTRVNHLFIESIYNESGYFEYDSTSNFAHLNDDGNFTVYDQLGAIGDYNTKTGSHGQFMPYNDLTPGRYCTFTNRTDVTGRELSDLDARKGEKLYNIGYRSKVDYQFGMEMKASFTQTADGLDAWNHDIIFEFSGDDDFWLYVDDELVLDLGGVHSAMTGSINFRTGVVTSSRGNSTLYDIFKQNYQTRGLNPGIVDNLFEEKTVDGKTVHVFKDYTNHTMRMFYMERGAGASNLHMRFNLAAVKPGTVMLSKKLSGTQMQSNSLIEFPYQIYYKTQTDGGDSYHRLGENPGEERLVTYKDTVNKVAYKETLSVGNVNYENVFLLKPGQSAMIDLPDKTIDYYIVECGVNTAAYDKVTANGTALAGTDTANPGRKDYEVSHATMEERPEVAYDNHVSEGAMRTLSVKKVLYDSDGHKVLTSAEDRTQFNFRLYLGNEFTSEDAIPLADLYSYYVKDPEGSYCRWDAKKQEFISLGIRDYEGENGLEAYLETLSNTAKESIAFKTSMNGSISRVQAGYTVEIRDLIIGTHWKVEEREPDIPKGYTIRLEDGYTRMGGKEVMYGTKPVSGTMKENDLPEIEIRNQKGWGLTVNKVWTDKDFMESHDPIYFAVYVKKADADTQADSYTLLPDSVREMKTTEDSIYYFFGNLQSGTPFDQYVVYEVKPEGDIQVDPDGNVTGFTSLDRIEDKGSLLVGGKPMGGVYHPADGDQAYKYTVTYQPGEQTTQNENVRTDTVTNSRPGIKIYKAGSDGRTGLSGAAFSLKDADGNNVAADTYISKGPDGLVTIAYLNPGTYTLTETEAPAGYVALERPLEISVREDESTENGYSIDVKGAEEKSCIWENATETDMAYITIIDHQVGLQVKKVDVATKESISGVHFALYLQVSSAADVRPDYNPIAGCEDLVTNAEGILCIRGENGSFSPFGMDNLTRGCTYYLRETASAQGYDPLKEDLCFTAGKDGKITINSSGHEGWLTSSQDPENDRKDYLITIPNGKMKKIRFKKVDIKDIKTSALSGAEFDLYQLGDKKQAEKPYFEGLKSGEDGLLSKDGRTLFDIPVGSYYLVETKAPEGYNMKKDPVLITVTDQVDGEASGSKGTLKGINYNEGTALSIGGKGIEYDAVTETYMIKISNEAGYELPSTGGRGTGLMTLMGMILLMISGAAAVFRKKQDLAGRMFKFKARY